MGDKRLTHSRVFRTERVASHAHRPPRLGQCMTLSAGWYKFAFAELHEKATRRVAGDFLRHLIAAVPYRVHTVLTDNGTHFTTPGNTASAAPLIKEAIARGETVWAHAFEYACAQNDVDHRLTKPRHPRTNGQVESLWVPFPPACVVSPMDEHLQTAIPRRLRRGSF